MLSNLPNPTEESVAKLFIGSPRPLMEAVEPPASVSSESKDELTYISGLAKELALISERIKARSQHDDDDHTRDLQRMYANLVSCLNIEFHQTIDCFKQLRIIDGLEESAFAQLQTQAGKLQYMLSKTEFNSHIRIAEINQASAQIISHFDMIEVEISSQHRNNMSHHFFKMAEKYVRQMLTLKRWKHVEAIEYKYQAIISMIVGLARLERNNVQQLILQYLRNPSDISEHFIYSKLHLLRGAAWLDSCTLNGYSNEMNCLQHTIDTHKYRLKREQEGILLNLAAYRNISKAKAIQQKLNVLHEFETIVMVGIRDSGEHENAFEASVRNTLGEIKELFSLSTTGKSEFFDLASGFYPQHAEDSISYLQSCKSAKVFIDDCSELLHQLARKLKSTIRQAEVQMEYSYDNLIRLNNKQQEFALEISQLLYYFDNLQHYPQLNQVMRQEKKKKAWKERLANEYQRLSSGFLHKDYLVVSALRILDNFMLCREHSFAKLKKRYEYTYDKSIKQLQQRVNKKIQSHEFSGILPDLQSMESISYNLENSNPNDDDDDDKKIINLKNSKLATKINNQIIALVKNCQDLLFDLQRNFTPNTQGSLLRSIQKITPAKQVAEYLNLSQSNAEINSLQEFLREMILIWNRSIKTHFTHYRFIEAEDQRIVISHFISANQSGDLERSVGEFDSYRSEAFASINAKLTSNEFLDFLELPIIDILKQLTKLKNGSKYGYYNYDEKYKEIRARVERFVESQRNNNENFIKLKANTPPWIYKQFEKKKCCGKSFLKLFL